MRVRLIDLEPRLRAVRPQLDAALARVIDRGAFVLGEEVARFEASLAAECRCAHAIGCASGSDALLLGLLAHGVGPGDQVIVPSLTFVSTATAVSRLGAEPVFADVDDASLTLAPASVAAAAAGCERLRVVVPVHLFGRCADAMGLREIAEAHGAVLLHDAAQAIGARDHRGEPPGASGETTTWSFYPTKNLGALGDAGAITTNDAARASRLRRLRVHGAGEPDPDDAIGINSRLDELQAAALNVLLPGLEADVAARARCADGYDAALRDGGALELGTVLPERPPSPGRHALHQYVVQLPARARDAVAEALARDGIETARYYRVPLHHHPALRDRARAPVPLDATERASERLLALPVHAGVTAAQREEIAGRLAGALRASLG